ncbi:MAG: MFS transporter [Clostridia bacterium]|nr:MFS transporter [Clostridia bacterium]
MMNSENKGLSRRNWLILILFGLLGQIAWSVENMYFNVFVFETVAPDLDAITLMVQLSGITATVATLIAGVFSDKIGDRRRMISFGYIIWGVTVAAFGFLSTDLTEALLGVGYAEAVGITLAAVVVGDCIMTLFGSTANDAAFNAWVTDNTERSFRGTVEGVLSILPLISMLIVAGGFGIIKDLVGYTWLFTGLGVIIAASGVLGVFILRDAPTLERSGGMRDIFYGFRPSVVKGNIPLYLALLIVLVFSVALQIFMPYMIIYMREYLGFSTIEYSLVFGVAIAAGAALNVYLGRLSDRRNKVVLMYFAAAAMAVGLVGMYFARGLGKVGDLVGFGVAGFVMISGYIFLAALSGSVVRDYTPTDSAGKLQGVRMVFSVLIPMLVGPAIGNAINKAASIPLPDAGADAMTTQYIPAPEIYIAAAGVLLLAFAVIPLLYKKAYAPEETVSE